jgi:serine/threonine protein kinase
MEWVTGMTLGEYIERNYNDRSSIDRLRRSFVQMESELAGKGIAHGDLQNGNVLVSSQGQLRLVDYDGIFVPGMNAGGGSELGHKHFQHPARSAGDFTATIDRFSFLVIDLSLWALTLQPDLFRRFSTGENILFSANDFADPSSSQVFQVLRAIQEQKLQRAVTSFATVCGSPISSVPRLCDFLDGRNIPTSPVSVPAARPESQKYIGALPVIDGTRFSDVYQHIGDKVELVGRIVEVKPGKTFRGTPYVFINFGNWREDCVRITLWSEGLNALGYTPDASWQGQWIVVNGLIDPVYQGTAL